MDVFTQSENVRTVNKGDIAVRHGLCGRLGEQCGSLAQRLGDQRLGDQRLGDQRLGDQRLGDQRLGDQRLGVLFCSVDCSAL